MKFFSSLFGKNAKPRSSASASSRPEWAATISAAAQPIQLCSGIPEENQLPNIPQKEKSPGRGPSGMPNDGEDELQPVLGSDNAVPWPMPVPAGVQVLTYWGEGSAVTAKFSLPSDAAMRIVARGGPLKLRVQRDDGRFLDDVAHIDGTTAAFGLMAIPSSGTYQLKIEASAELEWGVTVVYIGA